MGTGARFTALFLALGFLGVASLLTLPVERLVSEPPPVPAWILRALSLVQPLFLTIAAVLVGCWLAPRVGLDAPMIRLVSQGRSPFPALARQAVPATITALAVGVLLAGYGVVFDSFVASLNGEALAHIQAATASLLTRVLYGGVTEEIIARWGVVTLVTWGVWRLSGSSPTPAPMAFWAGVIVAALVFSLGHLPILYAVVSHPPVWFLALVIAANMAAGLAFGLLFWRAGIEAAMLAHALAQITAFVLTALIRL